MFRLGCSFVFLGLLLPLLAPAAPNEAAIARLYARGLAGDQQAVVDCIAALENVLATDPGNQRARVYLGSAETLRSRDLSFGMVKWSALRRGIALMDTAAAAAPDDAKVQLLRAVTNEAFPSVLGRRKLARAALDELVARVEKNPATLSEGDRELLYLNAGNAARDAGENERARTLWERGVALESDPRLQRELRQALAALH